jgi:N-methylhydantoinase B
VLAERAELATRMENTVVAPYGVAGGSAGRTGRIVLNPDTPQERVLPALGDGIVLERGDLLRFETCGGGGWGDPLAREPWRVALDVRQGKVSPEAATRDYGVVFAETAFSSRERPPEWPNPRRERGGLEVDEAATAALRARMAAERGEPAMFDRGPGYLRLAGGATGAAVDRVTGS